MDQEQWKFSIDSIPQSWSWLQNHLTILCKWKGWHQRQRIAPQPSLLPWADLLRAKRWDFLTCCTNFVPELSSILALRFASRRDFRVGSVFTRDGFAIVLRFFCNGSSIWLRGLMPAVNICSRNSLLRRMPSISYAETTSSGCAALLDAMSQFSGWNK